MNNTYDGWTNWQTWEANNMLVNMDEFTHECAISHAKTPYVTGIRALVLKHLDKSRMTPDEWDSINWDEILNSLKGE